MFAPLTSFLFSVVLAALGSFVCFAALRFVRHGTDRHRSPLRYHRAWLLGPLSTAPPCVLAAGDPGELVPPDPSSRGVAASPAPPQESAPASAVGWLCAAPPHRGGLVPPDPPSRGVPPPLHPRRQHQLPASGSKGIVKLVPTIASLDRRGSRALTSGHPIRIIFNSPETPDEMKMRVNMSEVQRAPLRSKGALLLTHTN